MILSSAIFHLLKGGGELLFCFSQANNKMTTDIARAEDFNRFVKALPIGLPSVRPANTPATVLIKKRAGWEIKCDADLINPCLAQ